MPRRSGLEPSEETPRATDRANLRGDGRHDRRARAARATPTAATARSTSRSRRCRTTASWRASITPASRPARASTPTSTRRKTRATSCSGRPPSPASRPGTAASARPAGLAHRVLGDGAAPARARRRSTSTRRHRPDLPAPRERDRAGEGATGQPFSRFWVHVEHLLVDEREDVEVARQRLHDAATSSTGLPRVRAALPAALGPLPQAAATSRGPRSQQAEEAITRADRLPRRALEPVRTAPAHRRLADARLAAARADFRAMLEADLNIPGALGAVFELVRDAQRRHRHGHACGAGRRAALRVAFDALRRRCSACWRCAARKTPRRRAGGGDRRAHRCAPAGPPHARLRRRRSHPRRARSRGASSSRTVRRARAGNAK